MKPGKPAGVARLSRPSTDGSGGQSVLVFCLPGNPVSALVCFKLIVVPALRKLAGHRQSARPPACGPVCVAAWLRAWRRA